MSSISAGTSAGTALVSTGDTTGALVFKTGASATTAMTIGADQSVTFVGAVNGIAAGTYSAIASGTLANGSKVAINADGTVSAISGSSEILFASAYSQPASSAYDPINSKIVLVYLNSSSYGIVVVGTVSGTDITYGAPVTFHAATTGQPAIVYDSVNQKFVILYKGASDFGYAIVGTVSGTSMSFGTPVAYNSAASWDNGAVYDVASGKVLVFYNASNIDSVGNGRAGTVSGTSISFGAAATINAGGNVRFIRGAYNEAQAKSIIGCCDVNNARNAVLFVVTVSGSTITYGTKADSGLTNNNANQLIYDSVSQKVIYGFISAGTTLRVCSTTMSGTTVTFGAISTVSPNITYFSLAYDTSIQKVLISYGPSVSTGVYVLGTLSGTSISLSSESQFNTNTQEITSVYAANSPSVVIAYRDSSNSNYGNSISVVGGILTNITATNYIGISSAGYTNGQTAVIQTVGSVDDAQTGLTPGLIYYVQPNGSLATTANVPSVVAGTAVAATKIIIKG